MTTLRPITPHGRPSARDAVFTYACPSCHSPIRMAGDYRGPSPFCPWCHGTGQVDATELDRWQVAALAQNTTDPRRD